MKILVLGYGNPGRQDDGLGPALIDAVEKMNIDGVTTDSDYQLNIEYAADLAGYDLVIFVDASLSGEGPFDFSEVEPSYKAGISTHSMSAQSLLGLAKELLDTLPESYILAIRGYEFDFGEQLSDKAKVNLDNAIEYLIGYIEERKSGQ